MDAAAAALNKFISGQPKSDSKTEQDTSSSVKPSSAETSSAETASANTTVDTKTAGADDTTVTQDVNAAVEHETVRKEFETREHKEIEREIHQDHYHTTVQPLKAKEVEPEKHIHETAATEERQVNNDTEGDKVKAQVEAERSQFQNTSEEIREREVKVQEPTIEGQTVHHHLHETIQPIIEKERVEKEVKHVTKPVHEVVKEPTVDLGVTKAEAIPIEQFQGKLSGEHVKEVKHDGEHTVPSTTAVTAKDE
ncbi:hypothetical protein TI39_contig4463g00002 [Zymoseptoria brevis]|uniref:Allergen n=1 Tax=Zymoseptoria brevis TaxID=1047168 RepID=A0A0F4G6L9_9PEZI|nr:hypothetical protein TI39_contig4463g00002 [Zymoseptoria brevis]